MKTPPRPTLDTEPHSLDIEVDTEDSLRALHAGLPRYRPPSNTADHADKIVRDMQLHRGARGDTVLIVREYVPTWIEVCTVLDTIAVILGVLLVIFLQAIGKLP